MKKGSLILFKIFFESQAYSILAEIHTIVF